MSQDIEAASQGSEVWQYVLQSEDPSPTEFSTYTAVLLPMNAQVLGVGVGPQGRAVLWAEVDPSMKYEERAFCAINSGEPLPEGHKAYVGTVQLSHGNLPQIWHIYEVSA